MLQIKIDDSEIKQLGIKISALSHIAKNRNILAKIGQVLASQAKENLEQGSPDGIHSYKTLKPTTLKQKIKKNYSPKPLQRTGDLKRSLDYQVSERLYLTALNYAQHHQFGAPKNNLPPRPIFSIRDNNKIDILNIIKNNIAQKFKI